MPASTAWSHLLWMMVRRAWRLRRARFGLGNYCLSGLPLVCKRPDSSLAVIVHEHRHVRGSMKIAEGEGTRWVGFGVWSWKYERACCAAYVACVLRAMKTSGGDVRVGGPD